MFIKTHQSVYRNIPLTVCKLYFDKTDFKVSALIKSLYLFIDHAVRLVGSSFPNLLCWKPEVLTTGLPGKFQSHHIHTAFEILFTYHKINPFKVYNSIFLVYFRVVQSLPPSILVYFCPSMQNILEYFKPKRNLYLLAITAYFPQSHQPQEITSLLSVTMKVLVAQSCLTLCDPMDCSPPGSAVHGILQIRILEQVAIPFSRGSF